MWKKVGAKIDGKVFKFLFRRHPCVSMRYGMHFVSNFARIFLHTSLSTIVFPIFLPKISRIFPFRRGLMKQRLARAPSRKIERHRLAYL